MIPYCIENPIFQSLTNSKFISSVSKGFYNTDHVDIMKITYELKKGIQYNENEIRDVVDEFQYHSDRGFGWVKFCLFLQDVNEENGPFTLIPGSQNWPKNISDFKYRVKTFYTKNHELPLPTFDKNKLKKYFNTENEIKITGKKGDLMVVNTAAYHKGGMVKRNFTREVLWFYTIFPSSFASFIDKFESIKKK